MIQVGRRIVVVGDAGGQMSPLSEITYGAERQNLIQTDCETWRLHYAYTLRHWLKRARAARAKIEAMYDARFFRMWECYLAGGIVMFESGSGCNYQIQYIRDRHALPITRDYLADAETRYSAATPYKKARQLPSGPSG